jgi:cytoskeleton protein RodZ
MAEHRRRYFKLRDSGDGPGEPAAADAQSTTVGFLLQQRRLELGQDLDTVARTLRIRRGFLEAIETDRYADLPGNAYVTGFLRSYADHLGLDSQAVLARFRAEVAGKVQHVELYFPEPVNESRVPGGALILVGAVVAVVAYGSWYALSSRGGTPSADVPSLPDRLVGLIYGRPGQAPEPPAAPTTALPASEMTALLDSARDASVDSSGAPAAGASPAAAQAGAPGAPPVAAPASPPAATADAGAAADGPEEAEVPQLPDLNPAAETAAATPAGGAAKPAAAPAAAEGPKVFGDEGPVRVSIRAAEESWIQVRDGAGRLLTSRLMRVGDVYRVPNIPGLRLLTGNAGGTIVSVDGKELPPLGESKQVLKDVSLDPAGLQAR